MMKSIARYFWLMVLLFFSGCDDYQQEFKIVRFPGVEVTVEGETYATTNYTVRQLGKVVGFDTTDNANGFIYDRYMVVAFFSEDEVEKLSITVDIAEEQVEWEGMYTQQNLPSGTWHEAALVVRDASSTGGFAVYEMCGKATGFVEIERQSAREEIFSGSFEFELCPRKTSNAVTLSGTFDDLAYGEDAP